MTAATPMSMPIRFSAKRNLRSVRLFALIMAISPNLMKCPLRVTVILRYIWKYQN